MFTFILTALTMRSRDFLVEGYGNPYKLCDRRYAHTEEATSGNIDHLRRELRENGTRTAAVSGWNGVRADLVLHQNGTLAPFDRYTNNTDAAFCSREHHWPRHDEWRCDERREHRDHERREHLLEEVKRDGCCGDKW